MYVYKNIQWAQNYKDGTSSWAGLLAQDAERKATQQSIQTSYVKDVLMHKETYMNTHGHE